MEENQHNNPWAEKLLQVSLPDSGEAWRAMESRLDQQMPLWRNRDRRRWVLLILLLLLLIGVCNCPGSRRLFHGSVVVSREAAPARPAAPAGPSSSAGPSAPATQPIASTLRSAERGAPTKNPGVSGVKSIHPGHKRRRSQESMTDTLVAGRSVATDEPAADGTRTVTPSAKSAPPGTVTSPAKSTQPGTVTSPGTAAQPNTSSPGTARQPGTQTGNPSEHPPLANDSAGKKGKPVPAKAQVPAKSPVPAKAPAPPKQKEEDQEEKENGLMAAIGLNQFFPLGGQQSVYNSDGTSGTLSDYIPVPVLRYYFNRKLYVQLEAQFNTPQATKKNLVISSPPPDTSSIQGQRIVSSASVQQLFYFNVPLSVHYTLFDHFDIGAGLQFSRLSNAIGSFDTTTTLTGTGNNPLFNPVSSKNIKSFKGDALYQQIKTNEFRFLLDMSYTYKHFIGGLRYNQALSKFVDIQIAPGQTTQGRNSSLQLYLRYILWDGRKKRTPPAN